MSEMNRCPFCESTNAALVQFQCGDVWVECQDCGAVGPTSNVVLEMSERKAKAIALWNKRPVEADLLAALETLMEAATELLDEVSERGYRSAIFSQMRGEINEAQTVVAKAEGKS